MQSDSNVAKARRLRKSPTDAERKLWNALRNRQVLAHRFRRQAPIGPYIVDFVCFEKRLIIEVDGGHHLEQQSTDAKRTKWLESQGFRVIRFWNSQVLNEMEAVRESIYNAVAGTSPPS
ncbi:MAG: endonuclease domain-containing protein [Chloroflexota bacterium]|nr:endonuclease domain-containing protein [Chloroflexota bacterium]